jgi:hypothetical protein
VQKSETHLFSLRPAYRFQRVQGTHAESEQFAGQNPAYGAMINYFQKDTLQKNAELLVLTLQGDTLRKLKTVNKAGIQRTNWDLRLEPAKLPKLRTKPRDKDWLELDKNGERSIYPWDLDMQPGLNAPLVPAGKYRVVYVANGKKQEQILELRNDPNVQGLDANIQKQFEFGQQLNRDIKATVKLIEDIEKQRADLQKAIAKEGAAEVKKDLQTLEEQLYQIESGLLDVKQTGARQDNFRNPVQVLERFLAIGKELLVSSGDHPPTDQQVEVHQLTQGKLTAAQGAYQGVLKSALWKKAVYTKP